MIISVNRSSLEIMSSKSQIYTTNRNFSGFTAELDVFRVLLESPGNCDWCTLWNEYFGKFEIYQIILNNLILNV